MRWLTMWSVKKAVVTATVAAVGAASGVGAFVVTYEPAWKSATVRTISWNMCLNLFTWCQRVGQTRQKVDRLLDLVETYRPSSLLLQETCSAAKPLIEDGLRARSGDGWSVHFVAQRQNGEPMRCDSWKFGVEAPIEKRGEFGIMVAVRGPVTAVQVQPLPSRAGAEQRMALCVRVSAPRMQVCNTHFSSGGQDPDLPEDRKELADRKAPEPGRPWYRREQANVLAHLMWAGHAAGYHTVTGGDFNIGRGTAFALRALDDSPARECAAALGKQSHPKELYTYGIRERDDEKFVNEKTSKIDYLYLGGGLKPVDCLVHRVTGDRTPFSDHEPLIGAFDVTGEPPPVGTPVISRAHAHNDEAHCPVDDAKACADNAALEHTGAPLTWALSHGVGSVEVDVHASWAPTANGEAAALTVGHDRPDPWGRTLGDYYLRPLSELVARNGRVHAGSSAPFSLTVDFKSGQPTDNAQILHRALLPYRDMLYRWDPRSVGRLVPGAVRIVVTGDRIDRSWRPPGERLFFTDDAPSYLPGVRDRPGASDAWPSVHEMPVINVRWQDITDWDGSTPAGPDVYDSLASLTGFAHERGREVRVWGHEGLPARQREAVWRMLAEADVDHVGGDHYARLAEVLGGDGSGVALKVEKTVSTVGAGVGPDGSIEVTGVLAPRDGCLELTATMVDWGGRDGARTQQRACPGDGVAGPPHRWRLSAAGAGNLHHVRLDLRHVGRQGAPATLTRRLSLGRFSTWPYLMGQRNEVTAVAPDGRHVAVVPRPTEEFRPSVADLDRGVQWIVHNVGWAGHQLVNRRDGRCLAAQGDPARQDVTVTACDSADPAQQWWWDDDGRVRNHASGSCLYADPATAPRVIAGPCEVTMHERSASWAMDKLGP
jgi:endonuclease/exonuclease/phosphatase family metal-dependent hydrolase